MAVGIGVASLFCALAGLAGQIQMLPDKNLEDTENHQNDTIASEHVETSTQVTVDNSCGPLRADFRGTCLEGQEDAGPQELDFARKYYDEVIEDMINSPT